MRRKIFTILLSILYTSFILIGNSFILKESFEFICNHILLNILLFIILFYILYKLIYFIFTKLDNYKQNTDLYLQVKLNQFYLQKYF